MDISVSESCSSYNSGVETKCSDDLQHKTKSSPRYDHSKNSSNEDANDVNETKGENPPTEAALKNKHSFLPCLAKRKSFKQNCCLKHSDEFYDLHRQLTVDDTNEEVDTGNLKTAEGLNSYKADNNSASGENETKNHCDVCTCVTEDKQASSFNYNSATKNIPDLEERNCYFENSKCKNATNAVDGANCKISELDRQASIDKTIETICSGDSLLVNVDSFSEESSLSGEISDNICTEYSEGKLSADQKCWLTDSETEEIDCKLEFLDDVNESNDGNFDEVKESVNKASKSDNELAEVEKQDYGYNEDFQECACSSNDQNQSDETVNAASFETNSTNVEGVNGKTVVERSLETADENPSIGTDFEKTCESNANEITKTDEKVHIRNVLNKPRSASLIRVVSQPPKRTTSDLSECESFYSLDNSSLTACSIPAINRIKKTLTWTPRVLSEERFSGSVSTGTFSDAASFYTADTSGTFYSARDFQLDSLDNFQTCEDFQQYINANLGHKSRLTRAKEVLSKGRDFVRSKFEVYRQRLPNIVGNKTETFPRNLCHRSCGFSCSHVGKEASSYSIPELNGAHAQSESKKVCSSIEDPDAIRDCDEEGIEMKQMNGQSSEVQNHSCEKSDGQHETNVEEGTQSMCKQGTSDSCVVSDERVESDTSTKKVCPPEVIIKRKIVSVRSGMKTSFHHGNQPLGQHSNEPVLEGVRVRKKGLGGDQLDASELEALTAEGYGSDSNSSDLGSFQKCEPGILFNSGRMPYKSDSCKEGICL